MPDLIPQPMLALILGLEWWNWAIIVVLIVVIIVLMQIKKRQV